MRLMRVNLWILLTMLIGFIVLISGCKNFGSPEYELRIEIGEGITGVPQAGTYVYKEFEKVEYGYTHEDPNIRIEVLSNGNKKDVAGELTLYTDVVLTVRIIDIRGDWTFTMTIDSSNEEEYKISFLGDTAFAGTFTDDRGYTGEWTVDGDDLTMTYHDWLDYIFTGSIDLSDATMEGDWSGEDSTGEWEANRVQ